MKNENEQSAEPGEPNPKTEEKTERNLICCNLWLLKNWI